MMRYPILMFVISLLVLWLAVKVGAMLSTRRQPLDDKTRSDFSVIQGAVLTLLGLIIGFSFSMAISRYDQRENYEEEEANAIGTEYLRIDLLPPTDAEKVRGLLKQYLDQRIEYYQTRDFDRLNQNLRDTARLQADMWSIVRSNAAAQPTPTYALVLSGMNDVLNRQGYTQAAWWDRIPTSAWGMMASIGLAGCLLVGYGSHKRGELSIALPVVIAIAFFLIADLDSPRRGLIHVQPQNLLSLAQSLKSP